tara:strand:- start:1915 stop:2337 length:423 start_codon:yes stop_codon:yes gene_type:complete
MNDTRIIKKSKYLYELQVNTPVQGWVSYPAMPLADTKAAQKRIKNCILEEEQSAGHFAVWLAKQIDGFGWSRTDAAAAFRVSRQTLHRWLSGRGKPATLALMTIAGVIAHHRGKGKTMDLYMEMLDLICLDRDQDTEIPF